MEEQIIKRLAPFVSEPFLDNDGLFKYRVSRYTAHLESGDIYILALPSVFLSQAGAEARAHELNEEFRNNCNL